MHFIEKLTSLRKEYGITQQELAEKLGVSRQAVSSWERGTAAPSTENLVRIGKLFGVSVDALVNDDVQLQAESTVLTAVAEEDTKWIEKRNRIVKIVGAVVLAASGLLTAIAAVILICSATIKERQDNVIRLDELEPEYLNPSDVIGWPDAWIITEE